MMEALRTAVLGAGSWGTALATLLARNGHQVTMWAMEEDVVQGINQEHRNPLFLNEVELPDRIRATSSMAEAAATAELVLVVVPAQFVRGRMIEVRDVLPRDVPIVICSKGIEQQSLCTMHQVLTEELPGKHHRGICVLSGPSFALEVARNRPTNVTVAGVDDDVVGRVQTAMSAKHFRVYTSQDMIGVELGGSLKNVVAIAAGAADGLELGSNTKAGLITRGLAEIARLAVAMGGQPQTMMGLSGVGDLILTCTGGLSRNRMVGEKLARGLTWPEIKAEMRMVAEGAATSVSVVELAQRHHVDMPIAREVYEVLHQGKSIGAAMETLLARPLKPEWTF
ncbi:MAG: NAD(P)-dependent glycerol-3-phosphate dehydrogenase [Deltaproteobacteria bacterium]|nr:NAD(P)-dependent glycerol-3-phosphate dehydrogenase [Deltaproteobacteria bacterium]